MHIFSTPEPLKLFISDQHKQGKIIGLVPTMGALHQGHLELIKESVSAADITVCSIYVNPTQFNDKSDLESYPRDLEHDLEQLKSHGCQAVFCPSDQVMYSQEVRTKFDFGPLEKVMEGLHRPGHFSGVAMVVSKLLHIVQPDQAFFGAKDWQQLTIIKQLVNDLSFPVEVKSVQIVREKDGLAMSSRNKRLTTDDRVLAPQLFKALTVVKEQLERSSSLKQARQSGIAYLNQFPQIKLDYLEVVRSSTLDIPINNTGTDPLSICIAAFLGEVRLIDNISVFHLTK